MPNEFMSEETKICITCNEDKLISKFQTVIYKNGIEWTSKKCKSCAHQWTTRNKNRMVIKRYVSESNGELKKTCSRCLSEKTLIEFTLDKRNKFGVAGECRDCYKTRSRKRGQIKSAFDYQQEKKCIKCRKTKLLYFFQKYIRKDGETGFYTKCTDCEKHYEPEKYKPYLLNGIMVKFCKPCRTIQPLENFGYTKGKGWRCCNGCSANRVRNYEHQKKCAGLSLKFSKADIIKRDGLDCYLCGITQTEDSATLEHLIPLSRGGNHTPENCKIACRSCNSAKRHRTVTEFKKYRGDYSRFQTKIKAQI